MGLLRLNIVHFAWSTKEKRNLCTFDPKMAVHLVPIPPTWFRLLALLLLPSPRASLAQDYDYCKMFRQNLASYDAIRIMDLAVFECCAHVWQDLINNLEYQGCHGNFRQLCLATNWTHWNEEE